MAISAKLAAKETVENLPDDATFEEIVYAVYVRLKIEQGLRDIEAGDTISHEEMKRDIAAWRESLGRRLQAEPSGTSSAT
jgi:predicted transcriptional regulator